MGFFEQEPEKPIPQPKVEKKPETTETQTTVEVTEEFTIETQLTMLAKDHKMTVDEIKVKLNKIITEQGLKDRGALAVLKSELSGFERSNLTKEFIARLIAVEGVREFTSKRDQSKYIASSLDFILKDEDKVIGASMRPTGKNAELYKKFWPIGEVFKFTCGYYTDRETKALRLAVGDDGKLDVTLLKKDDPLAKAIPTFQELAKPKVQHLNQMNKYVGQTAVFSGVLSRHMTRTTGEYMGIEISDGTVMKTLACFLSEPLLSAMDKHRIPIGTELWLYGYIGTDQDGNARISPRGIYPPA